MVIFRILLGEGRERRRSEPPGPRFAIPSVFYPKWCGPTSAPAISRMSLRFTAWPKA
jgi:hypothetical protein